MLKKKSGLFLGLIVLAGSACVTPTHASSAPAVIITHVQAGGASSALSEAVVVFNNSSSQVDVTGWCITNKAKVAIGCFHPSQHAGRVLLPAATSALMVTNEYITEHPQLPLASIAGTLETPSYSSGGIVGSSDTISLVDGSGLIVDVCAWSSTLSSGKVRQRIMLSHSPPLYSYTGLAADWSVVVAAELPTGSLVEQAPDETAPESEEDSSADGALDTANEGEGSVSEEPKEIEEPGTEAPRYAPFISELLPNPEGSDTGGAEYIELFNANDAAVSLTGYSLKIGPGLEHEFLFAKGALLQPGYTVFSNRDIKFTLLNSKSAVALFYAGSMLDIEIRYENPPSGKAWALIDGAWQYTELATPGEPNAQLEIDPADTEAQNDLSSMVVSVASSLKPCAANQYRSPETHRCRSIESSASGALASCKEGQVRNAVTRRCITPALESQAPSPCKEGYERNPNTNRCTLVKKLTKVQGAVDSGLDEPSGDGVGLYTLLAVAGVIVCIVAYALWEWRQELLSVFRAVTKRFVRKEGS